MTIIINSLTINETEISIGYEDKPSPVPENTYRINCVYYEQNSYAKAGADFDNLISLGINVLSFAFYKPSSSSFSPSGSASNLTDYSKLGTLINKWNTALKKVNQQGHIYIAFGGQLESNSWTEPFTKPIDFANNLISIHKNIIKSTSLTHCRVGFDLDIEDDGASKSVLSGFKVFITTFRNEISVKECPIQIDSFSLVYRSDATDHWMFELIQKYGPAGTSVKNGYQYQGLMVDNKPDAGDTYLGWWNKDVYSNILPFSSRVVNFYHYPDPSYFPSKSDNLLKWIKQNNVSVAWWEWSPARPDGGSSLTNMKLVCKSGGFPNCKV